MDLIKIGAFRASLRKEKGLSQAQLGELIGVSNKTVSRWETGIYMVPVEMLQALSQLYNITINELVSGERLNDENYREKAEENIKLTLSVSAFSLKEKIDYFKKKWKRDHIWSFISFGMLWIVIMAVLQWRGINGYMTSGIGSLLVLLIYGYLNNQMMEYVERNVYPN